MNVSLYQAAAALNANSRWQEIISNNLAAGSIPGYKKQEVSFAAVQAGHAAGSSPIAMPHAAGATNFRQGDLKATGVNTDVALEGPGFFTIQMLDGSTAYTRDGEFHLNSSGQLVTKQGHLVLGDGGPIQMDINNRAPLSIASSGEVSQGTDVKGRLQVVDFTEPQRLTAIGHGYFTAAPDAETREALETTLRQGFIEAANVSAALEMTQLITAMRMFEANQRVIQVQDERMGQVISELGNPS
jgi:flagellar basal-body rod protein FlgG